MTPPLGPYFEPPSFPWRGILISAIAMIVGLVFLYSVARDRGARSARKDLESAIVSTVATLKTGGAISEVRQVTLPDGTVCMVLLSSQSSGAISCDWSLAP